MILHSIQIDCAPNAASHEIKRFSWHAGDDIFNVKCAISKLQEWVEQQETSPLATALTPDNNEPIAPEVIL